MFSCFSKSVGYRTFHKLDALQTYAVVKGDGTKKTALLKSAISLLSQDKAEHENGGSAYTVLGALVKVLNHKLSAKDQGKCDLPVCRQSNSDGTFGDVFDKLALSAHWALFRLPAIPRGLQKLLAAAYILDKGEAAFDAQGKFNVNEFLEDDKIPRTLRRELKASYFENIHIQRNEDDQKIFLGVGKDAYAACTMLLPVPPVSPLAPPELFVAQDLGGGGYEFLGSNNFEPQPPQQEEIASMIAKLENLNISRPSFQSQSGSPHTGSISPSSRSTGSPDIPSFSSRNASPRPLQEVSPRPLQEVSPRPLQEASSSGPSPKVMELPQTDFFESPSSNDLVEFQPLAVPPTSPNNSPMLSSLEHRENTAQTEVIRPRIDLQNILSEHPLFIQYIWNSKPAHRVNANVLERYVKVALEYVHAHSPSATFYKFHTHPFMTDKPPSRMVRAIKDMLPAQQEAFAQFRENGGSGLFVFPMVQKNKNECFSFYLDIVHENNVYSVPLFSSNLKGIEKKDCFHTLFLISGHGLLFNSSSNFLRELQSLQKSSLKKHIGFKLLGNLVESYYKDQVTSCLKKIFTPNKNITTEIFLGFYREVFDGKFLEVTQSDS